MTSSRNNFQFFNNPLAIRQEIQRFESVHPSIYAIYDLIDIISDQQIAQQIRDHVVCIEDSFVNSQEWTMSRAVPELRLGIVGSINSGKSALVHRYLTGSYMQEESPEGGRFKKEIFIDNQSHLLLIRDEGGLPEMQFSAWVDAVIFVFSLENEASFNAVYNYYTKMTHFRNSSEIPIILVGTQDAINDKCPRMIDESRARKLANDLKRCAYYETCATYGLNVETVFQDACQRITQQRIQSSIHSRTPTSSRPTTPQGPRLGVGSLHAIPPHHSMHAHSDHDQHFNHILSSPSKDFSALHSNSGTDLSFQNNNNFTLPHRHHSLSASTHHIAIRSSGEFLSNESHTSQPSPGKKWNSIAQNISQQTIASSVNSERMSAPLAALNSLQTSNSFSVPNVKDTKELPTPSSTPTTSRKSRRRSNLFIPSKKSEIKLSDLGSGRAIPLKQGYLHKRSTSSLNKEWKKKYVTLCDDGRLTYHSSLHDYMDDSHGKEIPLQCITVKVPGQKPRGSRSILTNSALTSSVNSYWKATNNAIVDGLAGLNLPKDKKSNEKNSLSTTFDGARESIGKANTHTSGDEGIVLSTSNSQTFFVGENNMNNSNKMNESQSSSSSTNNVKKRHRRMKSNNVKNNDGEEQESFEFCIVSLEGKQWHFEAATIDERDDWVQIIEQEIFKSLQANTSSKSKPPSSNDLASMKMIKNRVPGNGFCADCDAPTPEWASLNLGILICIECSGIHRNLGSHISKVRSLGLDEWTSPNLSVMLAIGNTLSNSVYEANVSTGIVKPSPQSSREEKENWIRKKYESKEFIPEKNRSASNGKLLIEAVVRSDTRSVITALIQSSASDVNSTVSERDLRTALHLACAMGNLAVVQILIWNNANIHQMDHEGRTCLSYAKAAMSLASTHLANELKSGIDANTLKLNTLDATKALVEMLTSLGCSDPLPIISTGTLPRRRDMLRPTFEKLPSSVI